MYDHLLKPHFEKSDTIWMDTSAASVREPWRTGSNCHFPWCFFFPVFFLHPFQIITFFQIFLALCNTYVFFLHSLCSNASHWCFPNVGNFVFSDFVLTFFHLFSAFERGTASSVRICWGSECWDDAIAEWKWNMGQGSFTPKSGFEPSKFRVSPRRFEFNQQKLGF